jgi:lipopolysaccharide/colanic/teichoic acid biosynthesis glycosyltransferase
MYPLVKRWMDVAASAVASLVLSPVIALVAVVVWVTMGRPVLFRQERVGRGEKPFTVLKFRTMRPLRPGEPTPPDAERMRRTGAMLRRFSLDELPQLWNILRGDMSLVGPRPLYACYLPCYTPTERRRHEVRPGITGLAQVTGRNSVDWDTRLAMDARYVDEMTLALDLRILALTVMRVLQGADVVPATGPSEVPSLKEVRETCAASSRRLPAVIRR